MILNEILSAQKLAAGYGRKTVLRDICLSVQPGRIVTLIGPNGAGKSTVLKTAAGLLEPLGGTVQLDGKEITSLREREIAPKLSIMMTGMPETERMTVEELVETGRYPCMGLLGIPGAEDRAAIDRALALTGTEDLRSRDFRALSDGQRQRVLLARALCREPAVLVLDEPTGYLDIRHKLELLNLLRRMVRHGKLAVLMSLHELELAQRVSDTVVCVNDHMAERFGAPEEIFVPEIIEPLYGLEKGSYHPYSGNFELERPQGAPQVFVIAGGGTGVPVYRRLQREGIPFAAGILRENDIELPVAASLAAEVVTERPFSLLGEKARSRSSELMKACGRVICCMEEEKFADPACRELCSLAKA